MTIFLIIMKRRYIASIILVLMNSVTCEDYYSEDTSGNANSGQYADSSETLKEFPLNLDGSLRQRMALNGAIPNPGQSFVCSPISALLPLGKLVLGASGVCESELKEAIGVSSTMDVKASFIQLLQNLKTLSGVKLTLCSRIYVSKDYKLRPEFETDTKRVFNSSIKKVNLNQPQNVAKRINKWVKRKTMGLIPEIIEPDAISKSSSVILVNAVYFSGTWKNKFTKVEMRDFYTATSTRKVPMMTRDGQYKYSKNDALDCQLIEIPYTGGQASFVIFLPNTKDGLPLLLYKLKLAPELMQTAMQKMQTELLVLSMPKFNTSTDIDLKVSYEKLGLKEILKPEASCLDKIVKGQENLHVSSAIQKAVIDVNENGTTAAAASALQIMFKRPIIAIPPKIVFNANRPFYYFIKVKKEAVFTGVFVSD